MTQVRRRDALVEVGGRERELDRPRAARRRPPGQRPRQCQDRHGPVVLDGVRAVGVALDDEPLAAAAAQRGQERPRRHPRAVGAQRQRRARGRVGVQRRRERLRLVGAQEDARDAPGPSLVGLEVAAQLRPGQVLEEDDAGRAGGARVAQVVHPRVVVQEVPLEGRRGVDRVTGVVDRGPAQGAGREHPERDHAGRGLAHDDPAGSVRGGDGLVAGDGDERGAASGGRRRAGVGDGRRDGQRQRADARLHPQARAARSPGVDPEAARAHPQPGDPAQLALEPGDHPPVGRPARRPRSVGPLLRVERAQGRGAREGAGLEPDRAPRAARARPAPRRAAPRRGASRPRGARRPPGR